MTRLSNSETEAHFKPHNYLRAWWPATYVAVVLARMQGVEGIARHLEGDKWLFAWFDVPSPERESGLRMAEVFRTEIAVHVNDR